MGVTGKGLKPVALKQGHVFILFISIYQYHYVKKILTTALLYY